MDRYLIRYFLAVLDQGSFSRAAIQCNVSQPTLSVGISKLEQSLGVRLFFRTNQRVHLTEAGARFLPHARRIETAFNQAYEAVLEANDGMPLRLGVLHSIRTGILTSALQQDAGAGEKAAIELVYGSERELVGHLAKGRIDVALTLVERGSDRFLEQCLMKEGFALALSSSHRLAHRNEIAAEELGGEAMIVRRHCEALSETSRHFTERGVRPHFALKSTNDQLILEMVAAGLGLTVMPRSHSHPHVVRPTLTGFDFVRSIGFVYAHDRETLCDEPPLLLEAVAEAVSSVPVRGDHAMP